MTGENQNALTMDIYPMLRAKVNSNTLEVTAFGTYPRNYDLTVLAERDARRGEMRVLPVVGLVLLFVFGSVIGAAVPLVIGVLAVTAGMAGTFVLAHFTPVLVYAKNVIVMVGLGVAIDYSLFILSRFREELKRYSVPDALANAISTTGRAILFSGGTVAIGLFGMMLLARRPCEFDGHGGGHRSDVCCSLRHDLSTGLLAVLGPKVNAWRMPFTGGVEPGTRLRFWHALATVGDGPSVAGAAAGLPSFSSCSEFRSGNIQLGSTDVTGLPKTAESRRGWDQLRSEFQKVDSNPIIVVVKYSGGTPLSAEHVSGIYDLSRWLAQLPGVNRVNSIVDLNPATSLIGYLLLYSEPVSHLPQGVQLALKKMVGEDIVMLAVQTSLEAGGDQALNLVRTIRGVASSIGRRGHGYRGNSVSRRFHPGHRNRGLPL